MIRRVLGFPPRRVALMRRTALTPAVLLALLVTLALGACQSTTRPEPTDLDPAPRVQRAAPPSYPQAARGFNQRLAPLSRLFSTGIVRVDLLGADNQRSSDTGEATIQLVAPDRLALSVRKLGRTLFWLGADAQRYWFIDLTGRDTPSGSPAGSAGPVARVGLHARFTPAKAGTLALALPPRHLINLLALSPLDPNAPGATQWSDNARLLGITTALPPPSETPATTSMSASAADRPRLRLWLDAESLLVRQVELFDPQGRCQYVARLDDHAPAEIRGFVVGPLVARRVRIAQLDTDALFELALDQWTDQRISDDAFALDVLRRVLGVERTIDLDALNAPAATTANPAASGPRRDLP